MRHVLIVLLVLGLSGLNGLAIAETEKPITDLTMVAGSWSGWVKLRTGRDLRIMMVIKDDGSYTSSGIGANTYMLVGTLELSDGKLRFRSSSGNTGTIVLLEERGKLILRQIRSEGTVVGEYERNK